MKQFSKISARFSKAQKRAFIASVAATTAFYATFFWWPALSRFLLIENSRWTFAIYALCFVALARRSPDVAKSAGFGMLATLLVFGFAMMVYATSSGISD